MHSPPSDHALAAFRARREDLENLLGAWDARMETRHRPAIEAALAAA